MGWAKSWKALAKRTKGELDHARAWNKEYQEIIMELGLKHGEIRRIGKDMVDMGDYLKLCIRQKRIDKLADEANPILSWVKKT